MENKTIGINALLTLIIITTAMITPTFFDQDKYYCESRPNLGVFECDGFSKYVNLNGKCLNATKENINYGNKICKTGWLLVENNLILNETIIPESNLGDYECFPKPIGCIIK